MVLDSLTSLQECLTPSFREKKARRASKSHGVWRLPQSYPADEGLHQIWDCKLPDHFKYFKTISSYFCYCLPTLYIVISSHLAFVELNPSKHPALGTHFAFCNAPIPPQTYMSRNKELRHDILMFLSGDSLLPREGREPKSRGRRKASEKEWLRSSCGNSYSVYVPPSSRINPAGLPTQSRRSLFICMSCL